MDILVAEDNFVFRDILAGLLESWGYRVLQAPDGLKALEILMGADPPQMAILDWHMPGMDGVEICKRVRAKTGATGPYLLLMTGSSEQSKLNDATQAGADDFIIKPFALDVLRTKLPHGSHLAGGSV